MSLDCIRQSASFNQFKDLQIAVNTQQRVISELLLRVFQLEKKLEKLERRNDENSR